MRTLDDVDAIAAPVGGRVLFAGEVTSRSSFGTVHSAVREDAGGVPGLS